MQCWKLRATRGMSSFKDFVTGNFEFSMKFLLRKWILWLEKWTENVEERCEEEYIGTIGKISGKRCPILRQWSGLESISTIDSPKCDGASLQTNTYRFPPRNSCSALIRQWWEMFAQTLLRIARWTTDEHLNRGCTWRRDVIVLHLHTNTPSNGMTINRILS